MLYLRDKMDVMGISHPIPTEYATRIYYENKNVYIGKRYLHKVSKGDKFIIYESRGAKAYTGWADIKFIGKMKPKDIIRKYKEGMMITKEELKEYSKGISTMVVIEFENFEKFKKNVTPKRFVTVAGKYIYNEEFECIKQNKD